MDHTLSVKTAKFTSLENLYEYDNFIPLLEIMFCVLCVCVCAHAYDTMSVSTSVNTDDSHRVGFCVLSSGCCLMLSFGTH